MKGGPGGHMVRSTKESQKNFHSKTSLGMKLGHLQSLGNETFFKSPYQKTRLHRHQPLCTPSYSATAPRTHVLRPPRPRGIIIRGAEQPGDNTSVAGGLLAIVTDEHEIKQGVVRSCRELTFALCGRQITCSLSLELEFCDLREEHHLLLHPPPPPRRGVNTTGVNQHFATHTHPQDRVGTVLLSFGFNSQTTLAFERPHIRGRGRTLFLV